MTAVKMSEKKIPSFINKSISWGNIFESLWGKEGDNVSGVFFPFFNV